MDGTSLMRTISITRLSVIVGLALASSLAAAIVYQPPSKATGGPSLVADEEEAGLLNGPASYERMDKAIEICNGC